MREIPQAAIDLVKRFEGLRLTRYYDSVNNPTIGYGHLLTKYEAYSVISEDQAETILRSDLLKAADAVNRYITYPINDNQYSALIDFTFNLGKGVLQASTLKRVINRGDLKDAGAQFNRWVYAGATKLPGLIFRRHAEAQLFTE